MNNAIPWTVPREHPAYAGHFPGTPIFPGVLLLDHTLQLIASASGLALDVCTIAALKFLSPASPGDEMLITHAMTANGTLRFEVVSAPDPARKIASGSIVPRVAEGPR